MKDKIYWVFMTNIGRLVTSSALAAFCLFLGNYIDWMVWVALGLFLIYPLPFTLIAMAYGLVINPIKDYKKEKKDKELLKKFNDWRSITGEDITIDYGKLLVRYLAFSDKINDISTYKTANDLLIALSKVN